jgi:hypothetical protein
MKERGVEEEATYLRITGSPFWAIVRAELSAMAAIAEQTIRRYRARCL